MEYEHRVTFEHLELLLAIGKNHKIKGEYESAIACLDAILNELPAFKGLECEGRISKISNEVVDHLINMYSSQMTNILVNGGKPNHPLVIEYMENAERARDMLRKLTTPLPETDYKM